MILFLSITAGFFLFFGAASLMKPTLMIEIPFGLTAVGADGKSFLRSGAGGVTITLGVLFLYSAAFPQFAVGATLTAVTVFAGLLIGRVASFIADGKPSMFVRVAAFGELLGLAAGCYWLFATQ